jgi:endonuclease/exonuclease/phosphatase family metal-dependent hydrolase
MRLASFNLENLFDRAVALNGDMTDKPNPALQAFAAFNKLIDSKTYTAAEKKEMLQHLKTLGLLASDRSEIAILRQNRGQFIKRPRNGAAQIVANGRGDWVGWLDLVKEAVNELALQHTAQVVDDVNADVIAVIEVENRGALSHFNEALLAGRRLRPYRHLMLIDGNDERGIDVGLMTRDGFAIGKVKSHVDDLKPDGEPVFSRDCPIYEVMTRAGNRLVLLVNHFKSKSGDQGKANAKRLAQATRVAEIYAELKTRGETHIAVLGDLNDTPGSNPLKPLLDTDVKDVSTLADFENGGFPGTYGGSTSSNKIDYILLSPALYATARRGGIFRKGMWPGVRPRKWEPYPTLTKKVEAASDHGAIWVDLEF